MEPMADGGPSNEHGGADPVAPNLAKPWPCAGGPGSGPSSSPNLDWRNLDWRARARARPPGAPCDARPPARERAHTHRSAHAHTGAEPCSRAPRRRRPEWSRGGTPAVSGARRTVRVWGRVGLGVGLWGVRRTSPGMVKRRCPSHFRHAALRRSGVTHARTHARTHAHAQV